MFHDNTSSTYLQPVFFNDGIIKTSMDRLLISKQSLSMFLGVTGFLTWIWIKIWTLFLGLVGWLLLGAADNPSLPGIPNIVLVILVSMYGFPALMAVLMGYLLSNGSWRVTLVYTLGTLLIFTIEMLVMRPF